MSAADEVATLRESKLLLLEQLSGLREQLSTIHRCIHDVEDRLHYLHAPLTSERGVGLLIEQQALVQHWRALLVEQQEVLRQYLHVQQRQADLWRALHPSDQARRHARGP
jgi:hypothetical protein